VTWLLVLTVAVAIWIGLVLGMVVTAYVMKQPIPDWHAGSDLSDSRTQSSPRRAPVGAEAGRATQLQDAETV
jgi:hypothetical protein